MPASIAPEITLAKNILRGEHRSPEDLLKLAKSLKTQKAFHLAWQILARARRDSTLNNKPDLRLTLAQQQALCIYKDPDLPPEQRFARALEILEKDCDLDRTKDQETLGLAGAVYKYRWQWDAQRTHLEQSLAYYLRGHEAAQSNHPHYDNGYTGINAAFILDQLASLEEKTAREAGRPSPVAQERRARAKQIREHLVATLPPWMEQPANAWLAKQWWFLVTIAEAFFGLRNYDEAIRWLQKAKVLPDVSDWEKESTVRQFAALARLQEADQAARPTWQVLQEGFDLHELVARVAVMGKMGLALSGGGFRASLFHIGVLARLAELDVLRHVEVLSCVSGGSIIGAHYYLEVRHLLQTKTDDQITREDYLEIVQRIASDFLAGVQQNLRTSIATGVIRNFRMMMSSTYSHTERIAELYEKFLFARVPDGNGDKDRWLSGLTVEPAGERGDFQPRLHNWRRQAKVPVLILNATTLNTCHNWQFTASFMGESPVLIDAEIDGNHRLRRMYYAEAPKGYRQFRLGRAVAASSGVPGMFTPLALPNLYPSQVVRLVDGGVYDNQGAGGLLEQECTVLLISDASGQTGTEADPASKPLGVVLRSNNILQARVRQAQFADEKARRRAELLRGLMVIHLKKDLDIDPVDWKDCADPHEASEEARPSERRGTVTRYGVWKEVQRKLAAMRTDLDSFSDVEALALMTSGYLMTNFEFPQGVPGFPVSNQGPVPWRFLIAMRGWMQGPVTEDDDHLKVLDVGRLQGFKIWRLAPYLKGVAIALGVVFFLALLGLGWVFRDTPLLTVGGLTVTVLIALAVLMVGYIARFVGVLGWLYDQSKTVALKFGAGLVGAVAARLHLRYFDPWFLEHGRMPHLSHEEVLAWIKKNQAWKRVKKTKPIYARATEPDEAGKAFQTAEGTVQQPQPGHWLCVGVAQEPWFQKKAKLDSKYEPVGVETKQFPFDARPFQYHKYQPKGDILNWAAQVQGEGVSSFSFRPSYDPDHPLVCAPGTYVVMDDTKDPYRDEVKDVWVVQQALFESTYSREPGQP
jgi:predicted acylesterase/phospholipase RssA